MITLRLSVRQRRIRWLSLTVLAAILFALRIISPEAMPSWLPISCGALIGLPCVFCGLTRASHYLLRADWKLALYFNWLAFPLLATAIGLLLILGIEVVTGWNLLVRTPRISYRRTFLSAVVSLFLLWFLQIYLAVSQHKSELLNPRGPLYSLIVR